MFTIRNLAKLIQCNIVEYRLNAFILLRIDAKKSFNQFLMEKFWDLKIYFGVGLSFNLKDNFPSYVLNIIAIFFLFQLHLQLPMLQTDFNATLKYIVYVYKSIYTYIIWLIDKLCKIIIQMILHYLHKIFSIIFNDF